MSIKAGRKIAFAEKSSNYHVTSSDDFIAVDCTAGNVTIYLPFSIEKGTIYEVKKIDGSSNSVIITSASGALIDGASTHVINAQYEAFSLIATDTEWLIF